MLSVAFVFLYISGLRNDFLDILFNKCKMCGIVFSFLFLYILSGHSMPSKDIA